MALNALGVTGVSELVLEVLDLAAAERFYGEVLGLPLVERWEHRDASWFLVGERTRLGLWRPQVGLAGGRGGVHVHFAMHLPEERYDAAVARVRDHGLEVEEHAFADYDQSRAAYVTDPDGNVVELWTFDVARQAPDGRACAHQPSPTTVPAATSATKEPTPIVRSGPAGT